MTRKFIGDVRLIEACARSGCPVCACIEEDSRRALGAILGEHVTDPVTRAELRAAGGFCNWHAWSLLDAETVATGAAILYEDLLRACGRRIERGSTAPTRSAGSRLVRLRALVGRRPHAGAVRARRRCPACTRLRMSEAAYLDALIRFSDDPRFVAAYRRSNGVCVPHLDAAVERGAAGAGIAALVRETLARWADLRAALERFVAKQDYRNTERITDAEADSYRLAAEILAGRREIFANEMERGRAGPVDGRP